VSGEAVREPIPQGIVGKPDPAGLADYSFAAIRPTQANHRRKR